MILVMWQKKVLKSSCQSCTCYKIAIINTGFLLNPERLQFYQQDIMGIE